MYYSVAILVTLDLAQSVQDHVSDQIDRQVASMERWLVSMEW